MAFITMNDFKKAIVGKPEMSLNNQPMQPSVNKPTEQPRPNRIDVSKGSFQIDKNAGRFGVEKMLKGVVKDPGLRSKMAGKIWDNRGGTGFSKAEAKQVIDEMWKKGEISDLQSREFKKDLGAY